MPPVFDRLRRSGFDVSFTYHADAIFHNDFPEAAVELEELIGTVTIPIAELVRGGGGEAAVTQRLRRALHDRGWAKTTIRVEKKINDRTTFSQTHEVDHVKTFAKGTIALEIEWNNKDPFFDRDLENFNRLHADGAISVGMIVTRGASLQEGLPDRLARFAVSAAIGSFDDLAAFGLSPTHRQRRDVDRVYARHGGAFAEAWARCFFADKFGTATTHWAKLAARLDRGVGSPCPIVGLGLPLSCLVDALGDTHIEGLSAQPRRFLDSGRRAR